MNLKTSSSQYMHHRLIHERWREEQRAREVAALALLIRSRRSNSLFAPRGPEGRLLPAKDFTGA